MLKLQSEEKTKQHTDASVNVYIVGDVVSSKPANISDDDFILGLLTRKQHSVMSIDLKYILMCIFTVLLQYT